MLGAPCSAKESTFYKSILFIWVLPIWGGNLNPSLVVNPTRVRIQLWKEIPPESGWIFTHGRIFTRGKELAVTLVVFSTAWLVFLPDTLVGPDVTVICREDW